MEIVVPSRLLIAPPDLRTADPTVADEIYAGFFSFDGSVVNARGESPFALPAPTSAWRRTLTGFSWLRHLRAAGTQLSRENARALALDFAQAPRGPRADPAFEPGVLARRLSSLLAHSPLLLDGAEAAFYEVFVELLAREARALHRHLANPPHSGGERLPLAIAFLQYCVCADAPPGVASRGAKFFTDALERELHPDGCPVSRNPFTLLELLLDMLPLRQAFSGRGIYPPEALRRALDVMIPMLRQLQHEDLSLALFNGMGETPLGRVATIFAQEDGRRGASAEAVRGGYHRLQAGETGAIVDAGAPPPRAFSHRAHAGLLSFEYSVGLDRIVVNCGAPPAHYTAARDAARFPAAHSTLALEGVDAALFDADGALVGGPTTVVAVRRLAPQGEVLELSHDGFAARFGLRHERSLALTQDGARFVGEDRLVAVEGAAPRAEATEAVVRFHLHPRVGAGFFEDEHAIGLSLPGGGDILFEWSGARACIEESVFFATASGGVKSRQIALRGPARAGLEIRWSFERRAVAAAPDAPVPPEADV